MSGEDPSFEGPVERSRPTRSERFGQVAESVSDALTPERKKKIGRGILKTAGAAVMFAPFAFAANQLSKAGISLEQWGIIASPYGMYKAHEKLTPSDGIRQRLKRAGAMALVTTVAMVGVGAYNQSETESKSEAPPTTEPQVEHVDWKGEYGINCESTQEILISPPGQGDNGLEAAVRNQVFDQTATAYQTYEVIDDIRIENGIADINNIAPGRYIAPDECDSNVLNIPPTTEQGLGLEDDFALAA